MVRVLMLYLSKRNTSLYLLEGIVALHLWVLVGREGNFAVRCSEEVRGVGGERGSGGPGDRSVPDRGSRESGAGLSGDKTERGPKTSCHWMFLMQ